MSDMTSTTNPDLMPPMEEAAEGPERTICIEVYPDGSFKVGEEKEEAPMGEEGEAAEDAGMQPAQSIDQALELARTLLETPTGAAADQAKEEEAAFTSTFNNRMGLKK